MIVLLPWETSYDPATSRHDQLPPEQWRYWVIEHRGSNHSGQILELACGLCRHSLRIGPSFFRFVLDDGTWKPAGAVSNLLRIPLFLSSLMGLEREPPMRVTPDHLQLIRHYFDAVKPYMEVGSHDPPHLYVTIERALRLYNQLDYLPPRSEMVLIGLFAVIEALITHDPKGSYDSLSHQLRSKMPLLSRRFQQQVVSSQYFGEMKEDTIWKHLYEYRSEIVHGGNFLQSKALTALEVVFK